MVLKLYNKIKALILYYKDKYIHFIKYSLIGVTGVTLDITIFYLLYQKLGMYYQVANIISVSCGITNNFLLNSFLNFKMKDKLFKRFIQFYSVGLFGLGISAGLLFLFVEQLHIIEIVAKLMTIAVVTIIQFNLNKRITFKGYDKN